MRRLLIGEVRIGALAVLVAAATAACGSSGATSTSIKWTAARAQTFGAAVNLTAADVPGFNGMPHHASAASRQNDAQLASCTGAADISRRIVNTHSDDFTRGSGLQTQEVGSSVDVLPSVKLAEQDQTKFTSATAGPCLSTYTARGLAEAGSSSSVKFGHASIVSLAPPPGTSANSFGYRFVIPATAGGVSIRFYADLLYHRAGPGEVVLDDVGVGSPFPASDEQRLFSLLVTRAEAHAKSG